MLRKGERLMLDDSSRSPGLQPRTMVPRGVLSHLLKREPADLPDDSGASPQDSGAPCDLPAVKVVSQGEGRQGCLILRLSQLNARAWPGWAGWHQSFTPAQEWGLCGAEVNKIF